jgi:hypothetical protein
MMSQFILKGGHRDKEQQEAVNGQEDSRAVGIWQGF